jgi:hypothetical protein
MGLTLREWLRVGCYFLLSWSIASLTLVLLFPLRLLEIANDEYLWVIGLIGMTLVLFALLVPTKFISRSTLGGYTLLGLTVVMVATTFGALQRADRCPSAVFERNQNGSEYIQLNQFGVEQTLLGLATCPVETLNILRNVNLLANQYPIVDTTTNVSEIITVSTPGNGSPYPLLPPVQAYPIPSPYQPYPGPVVQNASSNIFPRQSQIVLNGLTAFVAIVGLWLTLLFLGLLQTFSVLRRFFPTWLDNFLRSYLRHGRARIRRNPLVRLLFGGSLLRPLLLSVVPTALLLAPGIFLTSRSLEGEGSISKTNGFPAPFSMNAPGVHALWSGGANQPLYAGTSRGVYRLDPGSSRWVVLGEGLADRSVRVLWSAGANQPLYAAASGDGVYRLDPGSSRWVALGEGLFGAPVLALWSGGANQPLYAAASGDGVYRLDPGSSRWVALNEGLGYLSVLALWSAGANQPLYAGTSRGVYRLDPGSSRWVALGEGLAVRSVLALWSAGANQPLYAGTDGGGVYRLDPGSTRWVVLGEGLGYLSVLALWSAGANQPLYAGTSRGGVYRFDPGSSPGVALNEGLADRSVLALWSAGANQPLYAGADGGGVYRLDPGSTRWVVLGEGLSDLGVLALWSAGANQPLYAGTDGGGVYRLDPGSTRWVEQNAPTTPNNVIQLRFDIQTQSLYAQIDDQTYFRSDTLGEGWYASSALTEAFTQRLILDRSGETPRLVHSVYGWSQSLVMDMREAAALKVDEENGLVTIYTMEWAGEIVRTDVVVPLLTWPAPYQALVGLAQSYWLWSIAGGWLWFVGGMFLAAVFVIANTYNTTSRPYDISLWDALFVRNPVRNDEQAQLKTDWPRWEQTIRETLLNYGDVLPGDLADVPDKLRGYALKRYVEHHAEHEYIEYDSRNPRLHLRSRDALIQWQQLWSSVGARLGHRPGLDRQGWHIVAQLAQVLKVRLSLILGDPHERNQVYGYPARADALRLPMAESFPLLFIADPTPDDQSIRVLESMFTTLNTIYPIALVIPLTNEARNAATPDLLRRAIQQSVGGADYVILSHTIVQRLLIARDPMQLLARIIREEGNPAITSPFVTKKEIPPHLVSGREYEEKQVLETIHERSFAIIGNRRIGKSSLLRRIQRSLEQSNERHFMYIDCTFERIIDIPSFCRCIAKQLHHVPEVEPHSVKEWVEWFVEAVQQHQGNSPMIILIDEVDKLLLDDRLNNFYLSETWRGLSNQRLCQFVFVGVKEMVRNLEDSNSPFFNFVKEIRLGYLLPEYTSEILTRPLSQLAIRMESPTEFLARVYQFTAGHPNLVQIIGDKLIGRLAKREERQLYLKDLAQLFGDEVGDTSVNKDAVELAEEFIRAVWGVIDDKELEEFVLEKLITLIAPTSTFRSDDIREQLSGYGLDIPLLRLRDILNRLCTFSILKFDQGVYQFTSTTFPNLLHRRRDIPIEIEICVTKLLQTHTKGQAQ